MTISKKIIQAAAGNAGEAVYVDDVFSTYLYAGNNSTNQIDNGIDLDGEGGLVWLKKRSSGSTGASHSLIDTERGRLVRIKSDSNAAEVSFDQLDSFNSDGFTLSGSGEKANLSGKDYVSWTFRKQPGFFDVVTYTGDGVAGRTVSHNLGSVPGMIIVKRLNGSNDWQVYHRGVDATAPEDYYLPLNQTNARIDSDVRWNDTAPTATEFTLGSSGATNGSGGNYVAYLFAHDAQDFGTDSDEAIIKCGSYSNSGSAWSVDLGFEPQFLLRKLSSGTGSWQLTDTMRGLFAGSNARLLKADVSNAENNAGGININSTGFNGDGTGDTGTWIYMAIARPHKPASEFDADDLFSIDGSGSATNPVYESNNHIVDMAIQKRPSHTDAPLFFSRLTGDKYLNSTSTSAEATGSNIAWDFMDGVVNSFSATTYAAWMFRRAPGFFDVVTYTGSSSAQEISHNLGVTPELIIQKCRTQSTYPWNSWYTGLTNSQYINLNSTSGVQTSSNLWGTNATVATDSVFRTGSGNTGVDGSTTDTHIAYLFATAAGISKVGTFNRPSQVSQDVDCGFTNGARFVLLKRTNTTGQWLVWDSVRGIVAGDDPYFALQSASPQVTNQDYIDPLSSGFTLTSGIATGDWLFLAIA